MDTPALRWETVACPLCGARDEEELLLVPAEDGPEVYRMARCRPCGMVFTNPRVDETTVGLLYPDDYEPFQAPEPERDARPLSWLRRLVLSRFWGYPAAAPGVLDEAVAWLARPFFSPPHGSMTALPYHGQGKLLEFGCGSGWLAHRLSRMGWDVTAMDFSAHAIAQVRQRFGLPGIVGTLPHPEVKPGTFDMITLGAVLEHVHCPHRLLSAAVEALKPGGRLMIAVPNIGGWGFRTFGPDWHGLHLPQHLLHFTPDTLTRLMAKHGLAVRSMKLVERPGWLRRSLALTKARGGTPHWLLRSRLTASLVARWTGWTGQGDDIHLLAEKQAETATVRLAA